jgi:hypothetical protein
MMRPTRGLLRSSGSRIGRESEGQYPASAPSPSHSPMTRGVKATPLFLQDCGLGEADTSFAETVDYPVHRAEERLRTPAARDSGRSRPEPISRASMAHDAHPVAARDKKGERSLHEDGRRGREEAAGAELTAGIASNAHDLAIGSNGAAVMFAEREPTKVS